MKSSSHDLSFIDYFFPTNSINANREGPSNPGRHTVDNKYFNESTEFDTFSIEAQKGSELIYQEATYTCNIVFALEGSQLRRMKDKVQVFPEPTFIGTDVSSLEHDKSLVISLYSSKTGIYQRQYHSSYYRFWLLSYM